MDSEWSKREAAQGCLNCGRKPQQVAVVRIGGLILHLCFQCLDPLHGTVTSLIDEYDGYEDE